MINEFLSHEWGILEMIAIKERDVETSRLMAFYPWIPSDSGMHERLFGIAVSPNGGWLAASPGIPEGHGISLISLREHG